MATENNAVLTVRSPRDLRIQGALGVLLVALGVATGLLIGGIARQHEPALATSSQTQIGQLGRLDDYALRHSEVSGAADEAASPSATLVGRMEDYALRHVPGEAASPSATQVGRMEDYALRHADETP